MNWRKLWLATTLLLLLAAAFPAAAQGGGAAPTPTPFWQVNTDPELNAQMDRVEADTAILRDLPPLSPVIRAFLTRDELLAYLIRKVAEEYPPEAARDDAIFYHAFDLMDLEVDLRQVQLDVLAEQIAGFYDPEIKAMFVISDQDVLTPTNRILYAHEFTHVLQDQHYDLLSRGLGDVRAEDLDSTLALQGLVEGDAMLITQGYQSRLTRNNPAVAVALLGEAFTVPAEALLAAPEILQRELLFPYTYGMSFTYQLFTAGNGFDLLNNAYDNPPLSTEHILHPERYAAGDDPIPVSVAPLDEALGPGWRQVWDRTLGEFYLREHLRTLIPEETASSAAAGWGGDRYRLYFNDETSETVLVWRTVWDTPEDATEFAAAYRGYGALRFDTPGVPTDASTVCWYGETETMCLQAGPNETIVFRVPDRAMIASILPFIAPVR